ncbi:hypothetical protein CAPTEDRAFT_225061 [Capitella teleta]|uniref:Ricin B lectin domain-containing protein n=1 Tax=Capitella teleta TaxID=283909 RepID=R7U2Z5_CAPTE|nr:hypothetical protein CAPTEDRAFT_225061 [Capitella teleta]|eukprot:ELU00451.1 hypothetical protein CAPTEDRAFT_225061 [Capitella teleta]
MMQIGEVEMTTRIGKYFFIKAGVNPSLVLEIQDAEDKPGCSIVTGDPRGVLEGNSCQLFYFDRSTNTIRCELNGFCLDLKDDKLVINPYQKGKDTQLWKYENQKIAQYSNPDMVLSVFDDSEDTGASIYAQMNEDREGQTFMIEHRAAQFFYIRQQDKPTLVMDVEKASSKPGTKVVLFRDKGQMDDNQLWYEDEEGIIRSKLNGFAMDASGKEVTLLPYDVNNHKMQWQLSGNTVCNRLDPTLVLKSQGGGLFSGCPTLTATEFTGSDNEHWSFEEIPDQSLSLNHAGNGKHFFLRNRWCGLVMELRDGVADPGTEVVTAYRSPNASMADHQLFYEDEQTGTIRSALNGYCIDVQDDIVVVNPYDPYSKNQQWRKFGKKVQNRSKLSLVLQVAEASMDAGANIVPAEFSGEEEQLWDGTHIQAKTFFITSLLSGKVLDVKKDKAVPGAKVIMYEKKGAMAANQLWYEDERGIIRTKLNGFVLDSSKSKIQLNPYDPTDEHHQWIVVGDRVQNRVNPKMVLDIEKSSMKNEANVCAYKFNGGDNQRWKFEYA